MRAECLPPTPSGRPTDSAHNNTFDKAASEFLYARCQELAVPLVVVSRFAAYAAKARRITPHLPTAPRTSRRAAAPPPARACLRGYSFTTSP